LNTLSKKSIAAIFVVAILLVGASGRAHFELSAFYFSTAETAGQNSGVNYLNYDLSLGFSIDRAGQYLVGWGYGNHTASERSSGASSASSYNSTHMGPRFLWMIGKEKNWSLGFGYYLVTQASSNPSGGSTETWKGTTMVADVGYNVPIADKMFVAVRLNYSLASFTERLTDGTTFAKVSYNRTFIYPSLSYVAVF